MLAAAIPEKGRKKVKKRPDSDCVFQSFRESQPGFDGTLKPYHITIASTSPTSTLQIK